MESKNTPRRDWKKSMLYLLGILVLLYLILLGLVWLVQDRLIYFAMRAPEERLQEIASRLAVEPWRDRSGAILGWRAKHIPGRPAVANRIVVFHGNAGYALHRTHFIEGLQRLEGGRAWEVYLFEYPGYGARPGTPGAKSFIPAARAALAELRAVDSRPIFLLGESIGSGIASSVASESGVAGLLLLTPFANLPDVAQHHYSWLPARLLVRDRWDNQAALASFHRPVAVVLAGEDEIIPVEQGRKLFQALHEPKRLWEMPGVGHNELNFDPGAAWWKEVSDFLLQPR